jgi:hypothetical protein
MNTGLTDEQLRAHAARQQDFIDKRLAQIDQAITAAVNPTHRSYRHRRPITAM